MLKAESLKELYEKDLYRWVYEDLELLKKREYSLIDWDNLLEEIEYIARRYEDELKRRTGFIWNTGIRWKSSRNLQGKRKRALGGKKSLEPACRNI